MKRLMSALVFGAMASMATVASVAVAADAINKPPATAKAPSSKGANLGGGEFVRGGQVGAQAITAPGFYWDHCQQTYRALGDTTTWCYLESNAVWIWVNDNEGEQSLIACAESNHWCGINVTSVSGSSFSWNQIRVFKY